MTPVNTDDRGILKKIPRALRYKVVTRSVFEKSDFHSRSLIGWGMFWYLDPRFIANLEIIRQKPDRRDEKIVVIVPSRVEDEGKYLSAWECHLYRRIPWWQRIILAAGLRPIHRVIPVRRFSPGVYQKAIESRRWLGRLDGERA